MVLIDMNTNLSPGVGKNNSSKLINVCEIFGLSQLITEPTRVTAHPQSLIDLCVTVTPDKIVRSGAGAIIGDGDRKRAPFLVLGLSLWYGTIFLFLEQIAPSCAVHARTCCEDFCGCSAGKLIVSEIPEMYDAFGPQLNTFMSVGILLQYFRRKLLQFELVK